MGMRTLNLRNAGSWIPSGVSYHLILYDLTEKMKDPYPGAAEAVLRSSGRGMRRLYNDRISEFLTSCWMICVEQVSTLKLFSMNKK